MDTACSIVMLAGPGDHDSVQVIFNHVVRTSRYPFSFRALTLDTLPSRKYPIGSPATVKLLKTANAMLSAGEIDAIFSTAEVSPEIEARHFGHRLKRKRDFRGIPLLGWAIGIERAPTDFICHFDSDILMHAWEGYSWVSAALQQLANDPAIMFVAPAGGPPLNGSVNPTSQKTFSSRRFVVDRRRLSALLPLPATHNSWKRRLLMYLGGESSYWPWESHVDAAIGQSDFSNIWLGDHRAWFLHSPDHGERWKSLLDQLVANCEAGRFPHEQLGKGELDLDAWHLGTSDPSTLRQ